LPPCRRFTRRAGCTLDDPSSLEANLPEVCEAVAAGSGVNQRDLGATVRKIVAAFRDSELAARLLEVDVVGRELPILVQRDSGQLFRGSIDLLYREPGGDLVVADYKTDLDDDDAALRRRYGGQLEVYAEAVARALELERPPRAELWLVRSGRRLVL